MGCSASTQAPTRTSNEEALAAEPEVVELLKNFCKFDSEALKLAAEDAVVNPPGAPPMPVGVMMGMMDAMKGSTFPNWKSHCHGVTKNPDGTYRVLTQQCPGPMKADFPAMGPFPHVALSSVPEVLTTEDLANPVEWGTFTLSEDKSKVVSAAYVITSHLDTGMLGKGSKSVEAVWGKAGDGSDVGFGAYFKLMGVELTLPPAAPPSKLDVVAKFKTTAWDGTYKEVRPSRLPCVHAAGRRAWPARHAGAARDARPTCRVRAASVQRMGLGGGVPSF